MHFVLQLHCNGLHCVYITYPSGVVLKLRGWPVLQNSLQNLSILDISNELIGLLIEVNSGVTIDVFRLSTYITRTYVKYAELCN